MTVQAQTNGALDRDSARHLGLAVGARWVVYGNVAGGTANLFVASVLDDRTVYADSFPVDDSKQRCVSFAAAAAARLGHRARQPAERRSVEPTARAHAPGPGPSTIVTG